MTNNEVPLISQLFMQLQIKSVRNPGAKAVRDRALFFKEVSLEKHHTLISRYVLMTADKSRRGMSLSSMPQQEDTETEGSE